MEFHTVPFKIGKRRDVYKRQCVDLPEEWENVINSNGKLVKNKVSYIKSGDGVNSVDRVIKTENVNQKLVYATVTYTNNSDQEIKHML